MDEQLPLIVQIITSVIAGHAAPSMLRQNVFGPIGRSLIGLLGGVGASALLIAFVDDKIAQLLSSIAGSAVSGAALGALFTVLVSALFGYLNAHKKKNPNYSAAKRLGITSRS